MPKVPVIGFLRPKWRRSVPFSILRAGPVLNVREGEQIVITYTSAADKMKVFSAFMREGLENGDAFIYVYLDKESGTIRAKLSEHGVDVEKYEKDGTLRLVSLSEHLKLNGKLDYEKAVNEALIWWGEAKRKGYKHLRSIQDVGNFSSVNGQWQKFVTDYWLDPRWDDPNVSEWVESKEPVGVVYKPFIMDVMAVNVEDMTEPQLTEFLRTLGKGFRVQAKFIDLLEAMESFSRPIGLDHERLVGRKILLEFDPASDYEKVVDDLVKESLANVEPIFVFTSKTGPIHTHLAEQPAVKFFLTSISTSNPEAISENKVLLPVKNVPLILEALSDVLKTYAEADVCFVFDILSELLLTRELEKTFMFLHRTLDMMASKEKTCLFLLDSHANEPQVVSQIRGLFPNLLTYNKNGLKVVKIC